MADTVEFRNAGPDDAEQIALLHADSWRRFYRGAYTDAYLDGDVLADRRELWVARMAEPGRSVTILVEEGGVPAGFAHVIFDHEEPWGTLVDNLHVTNRLRRSGVGRALLRRAAEATLAEASGPGLYLWVLQQNTEAQAFYRAVGGAEVERGFAHEPGGVPGRLNGTPGTIRIAWPDAKVLLGPTAS